MRCARPIHRAYGLWASRKRRLLPKPPVDELARVLSTWDSREALRVRQQADIAAECIARIAANGEAIDGLPSVRTVWLFGLCVVAILAGVAMGYLER